MGIVRKVKSEGISLKTAHLIMIPVMIVLMCLLLYYTVQSASLYRKLSESTNEYIELRNSAESLMDASDFLTDRVQRFTVTMDTADMDAYFDEVHNVRRREKAVGRMAEIAAVSPELDHLKSSLDNSVALTETEICAMKLICDANGYDEKFDEVKNAVIPEECAGMTKEEKIRYAQDMVHDSRYYDRKMSIRSGMENNTHNTQSELNNELRSKMTLTRVLLVVQSCAMIFILWMTSCLGINPILKGVQKIRENRKIPVTGSYEFRYLAKTYNKMYAAVQQSIENLNYDASHDKLTNLYNRAGYDLLSKSIDLHSTAVLIIDVDKFKEINDTYGHATGDDVLKMIAETLKNTFRSDDYICRVGGDEFVVFMLHMDEQRHELIDLKISYINKVLADPGYDLPATSISVGVSFGCSEDDLQTSLKHADEALYKMKSEGRQGCSFYNPRKRSPAV